MQKTDSDVAVSTRAALTYALIIISLFGLARLLSVPGTGLFKDLDTGNATQVLPVKIPDFAAITDVDDKKQTFFDFLQPYIDQQNKKILSQREHLVSLVDKVDRGYSLTRSERVFIRRLATEYRLETEDLKDQSFLTRLLRRVDQIPPSLVLAQAANESAWGTSRFAQQGKNFFGQWCFSEGCGLVPNRRHSDASHEVRAFNTISESVEAYFRNLNTFPSYQGLRLIREQLRQDDSPLDGVTLAEGLSSYSERGDEYINELQSMIYYNSLLDRDVRLTPEYLD